MSVAKVIPLPVRQELLCSKCGAHGEGSCGCGAPYIQPINAAVKAIKKNPEMSDRAIADELGISDKTVAKARKQGADNSAPQKRTGKDGKKYPAKRKPRKRKALSAPHPNDPIQEPCLDCNTDEEFWQRSLMNLASDAVSMRAFWTRQFGKWDAFAVSSDMVTLAEQASAEWQQLVSDLKRRKANAK